MADNYISTATENGTINISEDVIGVMVAAAVSEVEGVAGLSNTVGTELSDLLGKRGISKGVKVTVEGESVTVDVILMVTFGSVVTDVARNAQTAVVTALESMAGIDPKVNIHVSGVSFRASARQ